MGITESVMYADGFEKPTRVKIYPMARRLAIRKLRAELRALVSTCESCLIAFDNEMKKPSNEMRGKRIAYICNQLEFQKDSAKHFGLGLPLRAEKNKSTSKTNTMQ